MRRPGPLLALAAAAALLTGCIGGTSRPAAPTPAAPTPAAPSPAVPEPTTVATATRDVVAVRAEPDATSPATSLDRRATLSAALVFVVLERGPDWLRVQLPTAPAGSTGWVRTADVSLAAHPYAMQVQLGAHQLVVRRGAEEVLRAPVALGTVDRLTPGVPYFVTELLRPPDLAGPYGSYVYALAGSPATVEAVAAGTGLLAITGTNAPQTLGTDVPTGCVALGDEVVTRLAEQVGLPPGTPVAVLP